ncbi:MAG: ATP-binding cassette domain-containing protein [Clostridia bacterium]|nr:ATP-binding cassette domain-containing protein [Clostridia bacterium]
MEIFKIENLTFRYPKATAHAVDNASFSVKSGEFITICGKSGCGKTTLLRLLKPQLSPFGEKKGNILFNGQNIAKLTDKESAGKIGFLLQDLDSQIVCDKVWHELAFGLESLGLYNSEIRLRVAECASFFGIQDWFYKNTSELSGGQKQLLSLAAIVAIEPSVIILDEPTSQLDPIAATEFLNALSRINRELGITVIISEHRTEELFSLSDRVMVLEEGKIFCFDKPREVVREVVGSKHAMYAAMPAASRIFADRIAENPPLTVREGREKLEKLQVGEFTPDKRSVSGDVVLKADNIWFRYGKEEKDVLKGFSVQIKKGEIYAIVGGNGAGKSTALSVIGGISRAYRGKIRLLNGNKTALLPQSLSILFAGKTIRADLENLATEERINDTAVMLGIDGLLERHPYDLSGGELQRAALLKLLLTEPDILLLDEPTKGLDAHFKITFGEILAKLKEIGKTVVIVSHDIEFCAEYADRVAMLFDGTIISEGEPHEFFASKNFYTTAANRIARDVLPQAVLANEVRTAIGLEAVHIENTFEVEMPEIFEKEKEKKHLNIPKLIIGIVLVILFALSEWYFGGRFTDFRNVIYQILSLLLLGAGVMCLVPFSNNEAEKGEKVKVGRKRAVISSLILLVAVPVTILSGVYLFDESNYYAVCLGIILEIMVAVAVSFEKRKPKAEEIVVISVLCALAVAGRAAFYPLQQFKPVGAIVVVAGSCLGAEVGFLVGAVTAFVSNFFFGQGPWTAWQMISFGMMGLAAGVFFRLRIVKKNRITYALFGFFSTILIYGGIANPGSMLLWEPNPTFELIVSSWVLGLPYDMVHAVSTLLFLWFIGVPLADKLERMKTKYGL